MKKIGYGILALIAVVLFFIKPPLASGWIAGWAAIFLLRFLREKFYTNLLDSPNFTMGAYVAYVICTVGLIVGVLGLSFVFMDVISPYTAFAAFFADRVYLFVSNAFKKKEVEHVSN